MASIEGGYWTAEELSLLIQLREAGLSYAQIHNRMSGRSLARLYAVGPKAAERLAAMKAGTVKRRAWGKAEVADLRKRVERGDTLKAVAAHYNRSIPAILYVMQKHGIETVRPPGGQRHYDYAEVGRLVDQGTSPGAVARAVGCSASHARHLVRTLR